MVPSFKSFADFAHLYVYTESGAFYASRVAFSTDHIDFVSKIFDVANPFVVVAIRARFIISKAVANSALFGEDSFLAVVAASIADRVFLAGAASLAVIVAWLAGAIL